MMSMAEKYEIIPDIELHTLDDVPELIEQLASGSASVKLGVVFES